MLGNFCSVRSTLEEVKASPHGGGQYSKLTKEQVEQLSRLVEANNDATVAELSHQLPEKIGIKVSRATMGELFRNYY